jgi:hypothetical protein
MFFMEHSMPFDPQSPAAQPASSDTATRHPPEVAADLARWRREEDWKDAHREWLPYWQKGDPVPPSPESAPAIETPGDVLSARQEAFCRAYVEQPVAGKAARLAGYSPATARQQASRLLKHPLVIRRIHDLRDVRGADYQVRRDTIIDQAEAVFEAAMEKGDYYAAMQALTMKARMAGFADYLPGVRILRREAADFEQEFWARAHAANQHIAAAQLAKLAGEAPDRAALDEARKDAEMFAEAGDKVAGRFAAKTHAALERQANRRR